MAEKALYDTLGKAEERRRLVDLIPPPGPAFKSAALNALRRAGIQPLEERDITAPPDETKGARPPKSPH